MFCWCIFGDIIQRILQARICDSKDPLTAEKAMYERMHEITTHVSSYPHITKGNSQNNTLKPCAKAIIHSSPRPHPNAQCRLTTTCCSLPPFNLHCPHLYTPLTPPNIPHPSITWPLTRGRQTCENCATKKKSCKREMHYKTPS